MLRAFNARYEAFNWGVSNARNGYHIEMLIDGEWQRISCHFSRYRDTYMAMWHFAGDIYPWGIVICYTVSLKSI